MQITLALIICFVPGRESGNRPFTVGYLLYTAILIHSWFPLLNFARSS